MPKITPVDYRTLIRVFELDGFVISRQKGDHVVMTKPGVIRPVVIKSSPRLTPVTHIRTNLTTAGISRERYFARKGQIIAIVPFVIKDTSDAKGRRDPPH